MFKKIIIIMMMALFTVNLVACGSPKTTTNANITNYEEKEIGSKSKIIAPEGSRINSKGQLVVLDMGGDSPRFAILDSEGNPVGEIKCDLKGDGGIFTLDSSDNLNIIITNMTPEGGISYQLVIINTKGEILKKVDLKIKTSSEKMMGPGITDMAVDSKGNIYLLKPMENIEVLDKNGKSIKTIGSQGYTGICIDEDDNIIATNMNRQNGSNTLEKISSSTGKNIWKQDLTSNRGSVRIGGGQSNLGYVKANKSIYMADPSGVKMYDNKGKLVGTVLDYSSYTLLSSGYEVIGFNVDSSKNIYVTTMSTEMRRKDIGGPDKLQKEAGPQTQGEGEPQTQGEGGPQTQKEGEPQLRSKPLNGNNGINPGDVKFEIYKYSLQSSDKPVVEKKTITISTRRDDRSLQTAASRFQKDNPEYKIKIETPPDGQNADDRDKYTKNLNTGILSGKGPDIISTDWLPYEKYVSKNIFVNLSDLMAKDKSFDMSKYYSNILDAMKVNGNIYSIPLSFSFNVIMANQGILDKQAVKIDDSKWTWSDFKAAAEKVTDSTLGRTALPNVNSSDLLQYLAEASYTKFVDMGKKKASFDSQEFIDILNITKSFGDEKLASKNMKQDMGAVLDAAGREALVFYPNRVGDYMFYGFFKKLYKQKLSLLNFPSDGSGNVGAFRSESSYAINSNSKYKDKAWEFLKILLSDDIQSSRDIMGFSVNKVAQQKKAQEAIDMMKNGKVKIGIQGKELEPSPITQSDVDLMDKFVENLKVHTSTDENIVNIVMDETKAFFKGDKTVEEVTKLIQNRVSTYLGE